MTARETKPELAGLNLQGDFDAARKLGALASLADAPVADQPPEMIDIFNINARGAQDRAFHFLSANAGERTSISGIAATHSSIEAEKAKREKDEKRRLEDTLYRMLLDQLRDAQRQMAEAAEVLRGKYGEDIIGGMAAAYLSEDQLADLHTDKERLAALADIFLDEDGNIKPEYADSPEAKFVQGWAKAQDLRTKLDNVPMTPGQSDEYKKVLTIADSAEINSIATYLESDPSKKAEAEAATDRKAEDVTYAPPPASMLKEF
jgi:hypothetical protein